MEAAIFDDLTLLADGIRSRTVALLERHELTVTELCAVLQLPQSTVSRHLKMLADAGWVTSRREGTSRFYSAVQWSIRTRDV
jgi:DNA-binding transcriptional ArsR family regulator